MCFSLYLNSWRILKKEKTIPPAGLMKAIIRAGENMETPQKGNQVVFHYTTRTTDGVVVESTKSNLGGRDVPLKLILGKSKMLKGWEEGLMSMCKGEVSMLKIIPELHYGDPEWPVPVPDDFPKDQILVFEIELLDFRSVKVVTDDFGILKEVIIHGQGWETPREPYEVKVRITGKVPREGKIFFQKDQEPFHFTFGKNEVPNGLEKAIATMTRGEIAKIFLSPPYITGASAIPDLPLEADDLEFKVELLQVIQVRDMVGDGRLIKRRLRDGKGEFPVDCPLQDSVLRIHYKGILPDDGGKVFCDTRVDNDGEPLEFGSGEGRVPEGLEMCVKLMLPGELALVSSVSGFAYDKFPRPDGVPDGANVQWEVELLSFEAVKDWTGMNFKQIMDDVEKIKGTGNRLFKESKFDLAKAKYEKVLREFNHVNPQDDEEGAIFAQTRNLLNLNVAACHQKLGDPSKSIEWCNKVLEGNPHHVKALYRRGVAYTARGDFEEAHSDFETMKRIDKSSEQDANAAIIKLQKKKQDAEAKARKQFKGLFDKKPGEISSVSSTDVKPDGPEETVHPETKPPEDLPEVEEQTLHPGKFWRLFNSGTSFFKNIARKGCAIL
ncbi:hypothetical protein O6H91_04G061800 [Diphasiastrum complanatum]|uniref:Uncharacterized protein n=1 Tax=Diphasiastrum complanatum TaxID=34168 RepID=A0ACC2DX96_DIPCM|nr:hypothetical protein O6H91_04G061800 [Diphasiastrum complanatum]